RTAGLDLGSSIDVAPWVGDDTPAAAPTAQLRVVGVLASTGTVVDRALYANLDTAHQTLAPLDLAHRSIWKEDVLHYFLVDVDPGGFEPLRTLVDGRTVGQLVSVPAARARLAELTGTGRSLGLLVTGLIIGLGGLSVAAMMTTRFDSMTIDLAVLRALGF